MFQYSDFNDLLPWHHGAFERLSDARERLPQTWLVHGPRGIGKYGFVHALASGLLCESERSGLAACNRCDACLWFAQGNHPDFRLLSPDIEAEEGGAETETRRPSRMIRIEAVRDAMDFLSLTAHRGGRKVLIVHPAEAMNANAANAFLKTLEEPRPGCHLLLVSSAPTRLPATVISRCHRLALPRPDQDVAAAWLRDRGVPEAGDLLDLAGGAPLRALELAGEEGARLRRELLEVLARPSVNGVLAYADKLDKTQQVLAMDTFQLWLGDLLRTRLAGEGGHEGSREGVAPELKRHALRANLPRLLALEARLRDMRRHIEHPLSAPLQWESVLLDYLDTVTHG